MAQGCGQVGTGAGTDLKTIAAKIINILSVIVGIVAVVMIILRRLRVHYLWW